ncbi:core histone h2A/H2B/H3/H4 domain-containing protein [Ditylenchus destructor]|uniref:Core histone h2A/H2B/H3/H4 domain-containing protein n=1 Tax=Ditylenchus destructor TaxID=166010 RepID=A0AAD4QXD8_9BILA|nr:core histone h2A/H2B/H3/H4 domain-containing protein [Ditylenchus destructor]
MQAAPNYAGEKVKTPQAKKSVSSIASGISVSQKKRKKKKSTTSFELYIHRVLKQIHPDTRISKDGMAVMNSLIGDLLERIATESENLSKKSKSAAAKQGTQSAITARDVQCALRFLLPGELSMHAIAEGTKAVSKFNAPK